jgi:glucose-6-phosphate-specific signal transduction histidine kinase
MRQFTQQEIQDQFNRLPTEIQDAINASELPDKIGVIGKKYSLHTDQLGELVDEIGLVILGLRRSSDFVGDVIERMSISSKDANSIAQDVHDSIFSSIKSHLQNVERQRTDDADMDQAASDISTLERAGDFTVDKPLVEAKIDVTPADRPQILWIH